VLIDIAQREINAKTDLCFEYDPIKTGRKITHFRFRIAANVPTPPPAVADNQERAKLVRHLEAHGVTPAEAGRLTASYEPERIAWHLAELQRRLKSRRPIANPAAWLVQGIRDDYRPQPSMVAQADEQRRNAARARAERAEEIRAALATISKAYRSYLLPAIESFFDSLSGPSVQCIHPLIRHSVPKSRLRCLLSHVCFLLVTNRMMLEFKRLRCKKTGRVA
jgi:Initiator Rep protein, WH2